MKWPSAILFDLDGTLIDSAPDLRTALNRILARDGLGPLEVEAVGNMIGNGIRKLVERGFAACGRTLEAHELDDREAAMTKTYEAHSTVETICYSGVAEALDFARCKGIRIGVVTNKPIGATLAILAHFGIAEAFGAVIGGDEGIPRKPAPEPLWTALERLGVAHEHAVMVGDSAADVAAARAAGIPVVIVEGGYSRTPISELGADKIIANLGDLGDALQQWR